MGGDPSMSRGHLCLPVEPWDGPESAAAHLLPHSLPFLWHPSPEGGTTLTKDHPAILRIYDVGIWDSPHSKFEPILLGCFGEKIVFVFFGLFWCFWGSFSLSRAVSACFWPCICHQPTPDICLTHSDTIKTLPDTLRHHPDTP